MQIVIKIPDELYEAYKGRPPMLGDAGMDMIAQSIANGIPLPKGHGDLIDRDSLELDCDWSDYYDGFSAYSESQVRLAPTIIEADRAESEDEYGTKD